MEQFADVLIVTGQGVWHGGRFFSEYQDQDVYLAHIAATRRIARQFRYTYIVLSGGYTQDQAPGVSEAKGMLAFMEEFECLPLDPTTVILDDNAYDSVENVLLGLIAARRGLHTVPIRRVGIWNSWQGKKRRFSLIAGELAITERFCFHGHADWRHALDPEGARQGEMQQCSVVESDPLMLQAEPWETKRLTRYHAAIPFGERFRSVAQEFPTFFHALGEIRKSGRRPENIRRLRDAFSSDILLL